MGTVRRAALALCMVAGCSAKRSGPTPEVSGVSPAFVCPEAGVTTILVSGEGLAPAPEELLTDPRLALPRVELVRTADLDGAAVGDAPVAIPDDPAASAVRWTSQQALEIDVSSALALPPGLFDV